MKCSEETTRRITYTLEGSDIVSLLDLPEDAEDVQVTITVPTGGDYSGMSLEIEDDNPVVVTFVLRTEHD